MPEIPADYVAETHWEGSKDLAWGTAVQDLAYGGYNWGLRNPGEYLKITVAATDATKDYILQVNYASPDGWQAIADYTNTAEIVMELTEEVIALFADPNQGFIIQGDNVTAKKIELFKAPSDAEEGGDLLTNGDFEKGANGWMGWSWGPYTQDIDEGREGGSSIVFTLGECKNLWDAQVVQDIATLEKGTYTYEFYAKVSTAGHPVQVFVQETKNYQGFYGPDNHATTEEWTLFKGEIVHDGTVENVNRIGIQFGKADASGAKVWIDDFKFYPKK